MASYGGPTPTSPPGWQTTWSQEHNQWYYLNVATGFSQWEYPSEPAASSPPALTPQPTYPFPDQHQPHQESASPTTQAQPEASRGLMSMAAGAVLGHEIHEHSHHGDHHNFLDSMATFIGGASVGALGAKLFGKKQPQQPPQPQPQPAHTAPPASPPFQGYSASPPPAPSYPNQHPPSPFHMGQPMPLGPGHYEMGAGAAAGVATTMAVNTASNYPHHYQQPLAGPHSGPHLGPSPTGVSGNMGSFHGDGPISGPRLIIHAAAFADKDVTEKIRTLVSPEQQISLQKMKDEFGDPWPEAERKSLSILYQYGDRPMEVWAGSTENSVVLIKNEALSNDRMAYVNKHPGRIVSLIWGNESVLSDVRVEKLEKEGELDCKDLGDGGWWAWEQRTLICYYRGPHGGIEMAHAREGGTIRLPWNPLAKWS